jgi:ribose transport system substrate-binding protein
MNSNVRRPSGRRSLRVRNRLIASGCLALGALGLALGTGGVVAGAATHPAASKGELSSAEVSTLKEAIDTAMKPSRWTAGGPAFDAKSLKGKTIWLLNDATNQWADNFAYGVEDAAKAAGLNFEQGSGGASGTGDVQAIENAVNEHVSVIIEDDQPSAASSALLMAKKAHIPVILAFAGDAHLPTAAEKADGVYADATYCYSCTGFVAAEYEILLHGGKVDSQVEQFTGNASSDAIAQGWAQALKQYCPKTCSVSYVNMSLASDYIQTVQSAAQVAAQGGSVNVLFPVYDFLMAFQLPELTAANATTRISLASENADLAQMQELQAGVAVNANVGNPVAWDGWAAVDQAMRALLKLPPVKNENVPVRLFNPTNIGSVNLTQNPATWYGTATYGLDYEKLWGLR